jgi:hypothetical protein
MLVLSKSLQEDSSYYLASWPKKSRTHLYKNPNFQELNKNNKGILTNVTNTFEDHRLSLILDYGLFQQ